MNLDDEPDVFYSVESVKAGHKTRTSKVTEMRRPQDLKEVIRLVMESPLSSDAEFVERVDGIRSIKSLKGAPLDVQTSMVMVLTMKGLSGDKDATKLLWDYGGYGPNRKDTGDTQTTVFIDDMTRREPVEADRAVGLPQPAIEPPKKGRPPKKAGES